MKRLFIAILHFFLGLAVLLSAAEINNEDKPSKGNWDFQAKTAWTLDSYGHDAIAAVTEISVSDDGTVYILDSKNKKYYAFSKDGKLNRFFEKRGEGPGEIKYIEGSHLYPTKNKLIIVDQDKIHYFTPDFEYIESFKNSGFQRRPMLFVDEYQFITAPLLIMNPERGDSYLSLVNLKTGEEKKFTKFSAFKKGLATKGGMAIAIVLDEFTPIMQAAFDNNTLYYGISNQFHITASDLSGKVLHTFNLDREKVKATVADKKTRFPKDRRMPQELYNQVISQLPDEMTYFSSMQAHSGFLYFFIPDPNPHPEKVKLDIFSAKGEYLFRAEVNAKEGYTIISGPVFKKGFLYLGLEDEEGDFIVEKYKVKMPGI